MFHNYYIVSCSQVDRLAEMRKNYSEKDSDNKNENNK